MKINKILILFSIFIVINQKIYASDPQTAKGYASEALSMANNQYTDAIYKDNPYYTKNAKNPPETDLATIKANQKKVSDSLKRFLDDEIGNAPSRHGSDCKDLITPIISLINNMILPLQDALTIMNVAAETLDAIIKKANQIPRNPTTAQIASDSLALANDQYLDALNKNNPSWQKRSKNSIDADVRVVSANQQNATNALGSSMNDLSKIPSQSQDCTSMIKNILQLLTTKILPQQDTLSRINIATNILNSAEGI